MLICVDGLASVEVAESSGVNGRSFAGSRGSHVGGVTSRTRSDNRSRNQDLNRTPWEEASEVIDCTSGVSRLGRNSNEIVEPKEGVAAGSVNFRAAAVLSER